MANGLRSLAARGVKRAAFLAFSAFGMTGCSLPSIPIEPELAGWVRQEGTGRVRGRIIIPHDFEANRDCRQSDYLTLVPQTPLSKDVFERYARGGILPDLPGHQPIGSYSRTTKCDKGGVFSFESLPPGRYYFLASLNRHYNYGLTQIHRDRRIALPLALGPGEVRDLGTINLR